MGAGRVGPLPHRFLFTLKAALRILNVEQTARASPGAAELASFIEAAFEEYSGLPLSVPALNSDLVSY